MTIEMRPWGSFEVLSDQALQKVKRLIVAPGRRLSLQQHFRRDEHWFVVSGKGLASHGDLISFLEPGVSVDVPRRTWHRLMNMGDKPLVLIEIQTGTYFGEDDIERKEDDYDRLR